MQYLHGKEVLLSVAQLMCLPNCLLIKAYPLVFLILQTELKGCCCQQCMDAPRLLRPIKSKGQYGNWTEYVSSDEEAAQAMAAGRGEGRISRRRKRQQALKDRSAIKRAEKVERRRRGKEMMASLSREADGPEQPEAEDRMARLRQLKERLASAVKA